MNERQTRIHRGRFYTPVDLVSKVEQILEQNAIDRKAFTVLDTSCGELSFSVDIGADIDPAAIIEAKKISPSTRLYHHNSLQMTDRNSYEIAPSEPLLILGNPPYNDRTSYHQKALKKLGSIDIHPDFRRSDLGLSFLLSYDRLQADYICVLHPLSYLVKRANFLKLAPFFAHYHLMDNWIVESTCFDFTSQAVLFPIVIALYERKTGGMTRDEMENCVFHTNRGTHFRLRDFEYVGQYIDKYPNHKRVPLEKTVAHFWPLRDLNALRRNKTFVTTPSLQTIRVTQELLEFYQYVDDVKKNLAHFPYYFGNLDIPLRFPLDFSKNYFEELLGEHYLP